MSLQPWFRRSMRRAARAFALILLAPLVLTALYLAVAAIASRTPVNDDWREPDGGITIYVQTNGVHTGVVVPANAAGVDWSNRVHPGDAAGWSTTPRWLAFGWGDRDFYLNTPTRAEFSLLRGLKAVTGQGATLVHVDLLEDVRPGEMVRPLRLTPEQYRRLSTFIDATFADRREVIHGYGQNDVFYGARGHYSAFRTCNAWTSEALSDAGVRTALWSPFDDGVMRWAPRLDR
ncbi:TIGR02117 family protein [Methylosinus sporium]|uniref:TIGR02117 family protein n=1 Tax=Methylosinus sporium TaxID=428 RepID=A0A549SLA1_METSR|nr:MULTISPECIES: TIGR02117 family protein [Methylosinus]TRL30410.1 TIGR02117 family protein [Methylosinus sporium]